MKRIALAAAAALLGTGCIVSDSDPVPPPSGAVDFGWTFVRWTESNPTVQYGCAQAGIDNVLVQFSVGGTVQVPCADAVGDGAFITGVAPGTQTVLVTGRRGGVALDQGQTTVTVAVNQTTSAAVSVYGIPGDLAVYANFRSQFGANVGWDTCFLAGVVTLDYVVADWANTVVATGTVSCADPAGVSFVGPGALDLDNYVIRMRGFPSGSAFETFDSATTAVAPACSGQAFDHYDAFAVDVWDVFLYDVSQNATFCN